MHRRTPAAARRGYTMSANVKKIVTWTVVAFLAFYLISSPEDSANAVRSALTMLQNAAEAVGTFFQSLAG